jgi:hypothetical protein
MMRYSISRFRYGPDGGDGAGGEAAPIEAVVPDAAPEPQGAFEDGDDLDIVFVDGGGPKKPATVEAKTPSDEGLLAGLLAAQAKQTDALTGGLAALGEGLKAQQRPINVPQQQVGESDDDFYKRIEEEAYKPGQFGKALQEAMGRQMGPLVAGFQAEILDTKKQLLVHDPELGTYYKRFKNEVDQRVAALPRNQLHGEIYRQTLQAVMAEKGPELQAESIAEQVKKGIEEGLKAAGVKKGVPEPAMQALGGRSGVQEAARSEARERLEFTNRDVEIMIAKGVILSRDDLKKDSPYISGIRAYARQKAARGGK